ncbi:MAG: hypothetical protein WCP89_02715 [archaeon]
MKKGTTIISLIVLSIFCISIASAQSTFFSYQIERTINLVIDTLGPVFYVFLGGDGNLLFERILFFFIILSIVYVVLNRIPMFASNNAVIWIVTLAVSLLSTRFLTDTQLVQNILLPYGVLGVSLTAGLPFIIFFFFVESFNTSSTVRKTLWIFFIVVFIGMWASRYDELGDLSWIYFMTGAAALICLLADGTIRRFLVKQEAAALGFTNRISHEADIRRRIDQAQKDRIASIITPAQESALLRKLRADLKAIMKG